MVTAKMRGTTDTRIFSSRKNGDSPLGTVPDFWGLRCTNCVAVHNDAQVTRAKLTQHL
jgi:hypothetical protein